MPLVLIHTEKVRRALKAPATIGVELVLFAGLAALVGALVMMAGEVRAPKRDVFEISLSAWALPRYTLLSLMRGFAAYALSLVFTLVYGTIAAHNHRAEKVMIPALDVLQAIPVLGFLPGLVLAMVRLFPHSRDRAGIRLHHHDLHRAGLEHDLQLPRQPARHPAAPARSCGHPAPQRLADLSSSLRFPPP